jgi:glycosyltransferase involved in cell wall biosynthesis
MSSKTDKPIRVVMILGTMPPMAVGGAELQAIMLSRQLNNIGVETELITWGKIWHKRKGQFKDVSFTRLSSFLDVFTDILSLFKPKRKNIPVKIRYDASEKNSAITGKVWIGMRIRYTNFFINALVYLWFRRKSFDIIHAHMMEWPAFVAIKLGRILNKPVIVKDSTMNGIFSILRYPDGQQKQHDLMSNASFVAMTKMIRANLIKAGVTPEKISDIPNGIHITPMPEKKSKWNNKVIFVGNLTQQPAKGIDILLLAWKKVLDRFPNASLEIVGSGDLAAYREFNRQNDISNVLFSGKQTDVKERLENADIFVLPSRREGMSNALMEAMLCGLPVVATDVSGNQDLIQNNISGLLVPVSDIDSLSEALIQMMNDPEKAIEMGKKGYESLKQKCNITGVAQKYKDLYTKILPRL